MRLFGLHTAASLSVVAILLSACSNSTQGSTSGMVPSLIGATPTAQWHPASKLGTFELFIAPESSDYGNENLITGPDSNFYYGSTDASGNPEIVQFPPSGIYQTFSVPKSTAGFIPQPSSFVNGPDNRIWFGTFDCIIEAMTTSGSFQEFAVNQNSNCTITIGSYVGQDIWFTLHDENGPGNHAVGYINAGNGSITLFPTLTGQEAGLGEITLGPDGNMWFGYYIAGAPNGGLGRVTPAGKVKLFPLTGTDAIDVSDVIAGPDGALWFGGGGQNVVGRMSTSGRVLSETAVSGTVYQMTVGTDDKVWVTGATGTNNSYGLARFITAKRYQFLKIPNDPRDVPTGITGGPDGNMWFYTFNGTGHLDGKEMGTFIFAQRPNRR